MAWHWGPLWVRREQSCSADRLQWILGDCQHLIIQTLFLPYPPQKERIREKFVAALQREFAGKGLRFSRGEQGGLPWLCLYHISHKIL